MSIKEKDLAEAKIQDWIDEGYDVKDFFQFAVSVVTDLRIILDEISQVSLKEILLEKLNSTGATA